MERSSISSSFWYACQEVFYSACLFTLRLVAHLLPSEPQEKQPQLPPLTSWSCGHSRSVATPSRQDVSGSEPALVSWIPATSGSGDSRFVHVAKPSGCTLASVGVVNFETTSSAPKDYFSACERRADRRRESGGNR